MIPWTLRLMFWKPCRKCFAKVRKFSAQGAKITENQSFFSKKFLKALIWTRRMQFSHPLAKVFSQKPKKFWSKYREDWKTITFPKKNFSICFIGHLNCGFWNRIVNCLLNAKNFSPQMTKFVRSRQKNYNKIIIFKKCFSSKTSPGHVEWSSEKHTAVFSAINLGNLLLKVRQTFPQGTRGTKKPFFFHYFYFFPRAPLDAQNALLANPAEICSPKFQVCSLKVKN